MPNQNRGRMADKKHYVALKKNRRNVSRETFLDIWMAFSSCYTTIGVIVKISIKKGGQIWTI